MKIYNNLKDIQSIEQTIIALGFFDGIHKGHRELISRCISSANNLNLKSAVFTFQEHPKNVMTGSNVVKRLLTPEDKVKVLSELNIDYLFNLPFEDGFHEMFPEAFANNLLAEAFHAKGVFCGYNFKFGKDTLGNTSTLIDLGINNGFTVNIIEPIEFEFAPVSSSRIRQLIASGSVDTAAEMLNRRYVLYGTVIEGNKLGRTLGFPTVNMKLDEQMVKPANGVYITETTIDDKTYHSVSNVGIKPTVGGKELLIETHLFDFNEDAYNKNISVEFIEMLRAEKKFESFDALKTQIAIDKNTATKYFDGLS